jgi:hypothetical protein
MFRLYEGAAVSDKEIMKYLNEMGITTISQLQRLNKEQHNKTGCESVRIKLKEEETLCLPC